MRSFRPLTLLLPLLLALLFVPHAPAQTSLSDDARVGVVLDRQGTALVRPVGRERWTPVGPRTVLLPGDQVRTPVRGANAVEMSLQGGGSLLLGPGSLVEIPARGSVKLYRGDLEVKGDEKHAVAVSGPGGFQETATGTLVLRGDGRATEKLASPPRWLTGYRASTTDEWMGSLIASVDGRDVPLSVGYHKVTVEIRDQIARTTIEQSFRNATRATLEGVFYFPLPADASISSFGMWIGGELVEADIVEKQKARRIYEDILRRKKDPGLLEWSGGNLFKARVYPILPHAEKRIRIRYTQVLPLEGSVLRYRYGLRSELLRSRPLRELGIHVIVDSAMPIRQVTCTSHEARIRHTDHAASVEYTAEEISPDRDFEVALELDRSRPLTVVPHRRADDGYFMLLINPPESGGDGWKRDLLPETRPLDLVIVADTSGSMDEAARTTQAAFLDALLAQLGPRDRFQVLAADVNVHAFQDQAVAANEKSTRAALAFLDKRRSLGWTDLDRALAEALKRAGPGTQILYLGDGIGTTGDADPVDLARRIRKLGQGTQATAHAVSCSSTFESGVLEAVAALGGGTMRPAGDDPARAAFQLLKEIAAPALRDLRVSFEGLRTARVYPAVLPNLAAGTQQVVLGRFLPTGETQRGRVIVTGTREGQPVRFAADLALKEGETGNSFLPRLWARKHIDALLKEGRSPAAREEVVRFSETFGIMTPFTSFLVLESDADRERYGVERRVKMRDGERFFAEGRDAASTALLKEQMKVARTWRLNLRRQMLKEIATLGEHLIPANVALGELIRSDQFFNDGSISTYVLSHSRPGQSGSWKGGGAYYRGPSGEVPPTMQPNLDLGAPPPAPESTTADPGDRAEAGEPVLEEMVEEEDMEMEEVEEKLKVASKKLESMSGYIARPMARRARSRGFYGDEMAGDIRARQEIIFDRLLGEHARRYVGYRDRYDRKSGPSGGTWDFPWLAAAPESEPEKVERTGTWTPEALALVKALDRRPGLAASKTGIEIRQQGGAVHPLTGYAEERLDARGLTGPDGWFVRTGGRNQQPLDRWLASGQRGALFPSLRLGRVRPAEASDRGAWPFPLRDRSLVDLCRTYRDHDAAVEKQDETTVVVVLTAPGLGREQLRLVIDREKNVVQEIATLSRGQVESTLRCRGHIQAGGLWWPTEVTYLDRKGRVTSRFQIEVKELPGAAFQEALTRATAGHEDVFFLPARDPDLAKAKQAVHEKKDSLADRFRMMTHFAASQQWDRAWKQWDAAVARGEGKPGVDWISARLEKISRRGEALKKRLMARARQCAAPGGYDFTTDPVARHILDLASGVFANPEQLALLDVLAPALTREGEDMTWRRIAYQRRRANLLESGGRNREAWAIYARIAEALPFDRQAVMDRVQALENAEELDAAVTFLEAKLSLEDKWTGSERDQMTDRLTEMLFQKRDLARLAAVLEAWVARNPESESPYRQRVSVWLFQDRLEEADQWVADQLKASIPSPTTPVFRARMSAAIQLALGSGWHFGQNRIEEQWIAPLADLAHRLLRQDDPVWSLANRITGNWRFRKTDAYAELRKKLLSDLTAPGALETLDLPRLAQYLSQIAWGRNQVDPKVWRDTVDRLRARWQKSLKDREARSTLARQVLRLLDVHGDAEDALAFVRQELAAAPAEEKPDVAGRLMERLIGRPWTQALEDEILALVETLQPVEAKPQARRMIAAMAVRHVADKLQSMRYRNLLGQPKDYEKLPRAELEQKKRDAAVAARQGLAERLARARDHSEWGKPWYEVERIGLLARVKGNQETADGEARELFFGTKENPDAPLLTVLRERLAFVMAYCATRRNAPDQLVDRTVKLFQELADAAGRPDAKNGNDGKDGETAGNDAPKIDWRYHLYRLLVALDRPEELARVLEAWIVPAKVESRWRVTLGYIRAETGKLEQAAAAFEGVERMDELTPEDYQALANWNLVLDRKDARERALDRHYQVMSEGRLSQVLNQAIQRTSRRGSGVPESLDPDTLRALRALLAKASRPASYGWQVDRLYRQVKDHRILACLADGMVGHTAWGVYPLLTRVGQTLGNVHEEATCDEVLARIREVADDPKLGALDRRALRFLTALVERRAAEVKNAPGPHARRGLEALQAAFKGSWSPHERPAMAQFLASLGRITPHTYAAEQLKQLAALHQAETPGTDDRLTVARHLYGTLWAYRQYDAAIDGLTAALKEYRESHGGVLPDPLRTGVDTLLGWLMSRKRYARAEAYVEQELKQQTVRSIRNQLRQKLYMVYLQALAKGGTVSLGQGKTLYREARKAIEAALWRHGPDQLRETFGQFVSLHTVAQKEAGINGAGRDLERYTREQLPELLTLAHTDGPRLVNTAAYALRNLVGPKAGLRLVLDRMEAEPRWYARVNLGGWSQYGWNVARWRAETGDVGDLESRLLKMVVTELERDLTDMAARNQSIYHRGNRYFWAAMADEFAAVASRVIELNPDSPARLLYTAKYLWSGLGLRERAVGVLQDAEARGRLREDGRHQLVYWLFELRRFPESLPVLARLRAERPDNLTYRTQQIRALHETGQDPAAQKLLADTQKRFQELDRWQERVIAALAECARQCRFHKESVALYEEVIPLHQRTHPNRGVGNGQLANYYGWLARAHAALGHADQAVDAASSAVVVWAGNSRNRGRALDSLRHVIQSIGDLDGYVARMDNKVTETGLDAPLLRKILGRVYLERKQPGPAITQLTLARTLQPDDAEIHRLLLQAYDLADDQAGACDTLYTSIALAPLNLELYPDLGRRLDELGQKDEAERAWTTLAEVKPNEAAGHRTLAEHWAKAGKPEDAVVQWQQVVRCRAEEPDGWFGLARAQLEAGDRAGARKTVDHLMETKWEDRFGDVKKKAAGLMREM